MSGLVSGQGSGQRGFTLLEVVLAVGIVALIMTLVISSINVQSRVGRAARRSTEMDQLARTSLDIMAADLEMALKADPGAGKENQDDEFSGVIRGKASGTRLRPGYEFAVLKRTAQGEPVVRAIYTTAKPRREEDGPMIIVRRERSLLGLPQGPEETVCRRVSRFSISWIRAASGAKIAGDITGGQAADGADATADDAAGGTASDDSGAAAGQWTGSWQGDPPPSAAKLELTLLDQDGAPELFERTVILLSGLSWTKTQAAK